jgi:hypothetical protein
MLRLICFAGSGTINLKRVMHQIRIEFEGYHGLKSVTEGADGGCESLGLIHKPFNSENSDNRTPCVGSTIELSLRV